MNRGARVAVVTLLATLELACGRDGHGVRDADQAVLAAPSFPLSSPAFSAGAPIPARFTADGEDVSPALRWGAPPSGTAELVLICHDPDAPRPEGWTHWVLGRIAAGLRELPEGIDATERPSAVPGALSGKNDFGRLGWGGPSPPRGHGVHHYHFVLYALDRPSGMRPGASKGQVEAAIRGHVIGRAELVGTYERR